MSYPPQPDPEMVVMDDLDYPSSDPHALLPPRPFAAETRVTHVVFPGTTNHHGTLFGGEALSMRYSPQEALLCLQRKPSNFRML